MACWKKIKKKEQKREEKKEIKGRESLQKDEGKKPEKPETNETETAVCKKRYLRTDLKCAKSKSHRGFRTTIQRRFVRSFWSLSLERLQNKQAFIEKHLKWESNNPAQKDQRKR